MTVLLAPSYFLNGVSICHILSILLLRGMGTARGDAENQGFVLVP